MDGSWSSRCVRFDGAQFTFLLAGSLPLSPVFSTALFPAELGPSRGCTLAKGDLGAQAALISHSLWFLELLWVTSVVHEVMTSQWSSGGAEAALLGEVHGAASLPHAGPTVHTHGAPQGSTKGLCFSRCVSASAAAGGGGAGGVQHSVPHPSQAPRGPDKRRGTP